MALTELSNVQKATVVALVEAGRLDTVPVDESRASSFMHQAEERLGQLPLLTSPAVRYGIAYDAAHQDRYQAKPVGAAAADQAGQVARELFEAAVARGVAP